MKSTITMITTITTPIMIYIIVDDDDSVVDLSSLVHFEISSFPHTPPVLHFRVRLPVVPCGQAISAVCPTFV